MFNTTAAIKSSVSATYATTPNTNVISSSSITSYLRSCGFTVLSTPALVSTNQWSASISVGGHCYRIYVYTSGCSILGHEDVPI